MSSRNARKISSRKSRRDKPRKVSSQKVKRDKSRKVSSKKVRRDKSRKVSSQKVRRDKSRKVSSQKVRRDKSRKVSSRKVRRVSSHKKKDKMTIFVKTMMGDLVQVDVEKNDTVINLKRMVIDILNTKLDKSVRIIDPDNPAAELEDKKTLGKYGIKDGDFLLIIFDYTDDPPFKDEKWIHMSGSDLNIFETNNALQPYNPNNSNKYNRPNQPRDKPVKHYTKLANPAMMDYEGQSYQGRIDDNEFLTLLDIYHPEKTKMLKFIEEINGILAEEKQIKYAYAKRRNFYQDMSFIITNSDCSIVYEHSPTAQQNRIYIRGYFIKVLTWRALNIDERLQMIEDDEFLKYVVANEWGFISRKKEDDQKKPKKPKK